VLLEVTLSIGLFVAAAAFCIAVTRSLFETLDRASRRQFATDLARSKLAELEAGLTSIQDLRGPWSGNVGSRDRGAADVDERVATPWQLDVKTSPSPFRGLSLIELTVSELPEAAPDPVEVTLRQLVALRERDAERYERDEIEAGP
jgi:hypothetical protein